MLLGTDLVCKLCSHLMGTFYRTIRLVEQGIKPVYVFDGKPPNLKSGELAKRAERRDEAQKLLQAAEEDGNDKLYFVNEVLLQNNTSKITYCVLRKKIAKDFHSRCVLLKEMWRLWTSLLGDWLKLQKLTPMTLNNYFS